MIPLGPEPQSEGGWNRILSNENERAHSTTGVIAVPHEKLPFEVIGHVFSYCVVHSYGYKYDGIMLPPIKSSSWCNFSHVCSQWRKIALDTPSLWSRLHIHYEDGGMEDRVASIFQEILSRTRSMPLGLIFTCPQWAGNDYDGFQVNPLNLIMPVADRLQSLTLAFPYSFPCITKFLLLPPGLFGMLKHFDLSALTDEEVLMDGLLDTYKQLKSTVFGAAASLRSVRLDTAPGYDHSFQLPLQLPWAQMTHLRLEGAIELGEIHHILSQCQLLVHCRLVIIEDDVDSEVHVFLGNIFLPKLRTLKLFFEDFAAGNVGDTLQPLVAPSLITLRLQLPLDIGPEKYTEAGIIPLLERSSCQLENFKTNLNIPEEQLETLLALTPNLSKLKLSQSRHDHKVPDNVLVKMARGVLLPKLKYLTCMVHNPFLLVDMLEARLLLDPAGGSIQKVHAICAASRDEVRLAKERLRMPPFNKNATYTLEARR